MSRGYSLPHGQPFVAFAELCIQYYVCARVATNSLFAPVAGNLFHHALECLLKASLSEKYSERELAHPKKFGHDLTRLWAEFKNLHPNRVLDGFDDLVTSLNKWEEIRYPANFGSLEISVDQDHTITFPDSSNYSLNLNDMDYLFSALIILMDLKEFFDHRLWYPYERGMYLFRNNHPVINSEPSF